MVKKAIGMVCFICGVLLLGFVGYLGIIMAGDDVIDDKALVLNSATKLVDENGNIITRVYAENREPVSIDDVPDHVKNAFVAVEDSRFYKHHGLDTHAIFRAVYKDILSGGKVEGASTITQQLAKNVFLTNEKSWLRKTKEAIISLNLERRYSKDKILEMYLNQIYFGHGAYGIEAASRLYFNKKVSDLTLDEGALLAGLLKAPGVYSPLEHPDRSKKRRNLVLDLMEEQHFIRPEEAVRAQGKTVALTIHKEERNPAYLTYVDMVLTEAKEKYHLSREELRRGGYKIVVPLNVKAQNAAYKTFQKRYYFKGTGKEPPEGAFVLMDSKTGGIIAATGGRNYLTEGLNRVYVPRQPGSAFKPLAVYGPALEKKKFWPYSLLKDEPLNYDGYVPENTNHEYRGKISMYEAIQHSTNAPSVWLLNKIGIHYSKEYLNKLGMPVTDRGLGIALGGLTKGVSPLQMVKAYRAFSQKGKIVEPYVISKIYDHDGQLIGQAEPIEKKVFSKQTAWNMTRMLEAAVEKGTGKYGKIHTALAGKTGTTNIDGQEDGNRDAWFVGYTPDIVGAVWIGYDRTTKESYLNSGSRYPTELFKAIINQIPSENHLTFHKPKGIKDLEPPIKMIDVKNVEGHVGFGPLGMPTVKLTWTPSKDKRLKYKIYAVQNGASEFIATVRGKGEYTTSSRFLFSLPEFYVVPYNPLTKERGKPSNIAAVDIFR
ncbi:PBP1A family penicillin-binding protein [Fictibacillus sp. Mic-4]|uniref:transglycosylase domain-containing protein n=1 Tax=Fictibacillus sp. Mic-4 TaxID=3132826 RepID=UPI003CF529BE